MLVAVGAWVQWCVARDGKKTADIRTVAHWGGLQGSRCGFASVPWMQWTMGSGLKDDRCSRQQNLFFYWFSLSQILGTCKTCIFVDDILPTMIWKASQLKTNRCIHGTLLYWTYFNSKARKWGPMKNESGHSWQDPCLLKHIKDCINWTNWIVLALEMDLQREMCMTKLVVGVLWAEALQEYLWDGTGRDWATAVWQPVA